MEALNQVKISESSSAFDIPAEHAGKLAELREHATVKGCTVAPEDQAYWTTDGALQRFLVARSYDVAKAAEMYAATMQFRIERGCGKILSNPDYKEPAVLAQLFPFGVTGLDKDGFPVLVEKIGLIDLIGFHATVGIEEFLQVRGEGGPPRNGGFVEWLTERRRWGEGRTKEKR